jgi:hypothetical protein
VAVYTKFYGIFNYIESANTKIHAFNNGSRINLLFQRYCKYQELYLTLIVEEYGDSMEKKFKELKNIEISPA